MKRILVGIVSLVILFSCSKDSVAPTIYMCTVYDYSMNGTKKEVSNKNPFSFAGMSVASTDIYIVGEEIASVKSGYALALAKYWKNGIGVNLTDSTKGSYATDIFIDGNDIYVAGTETRDTTSGVKFSDPVGLQNLKATYWKNGVAVALTDGSTDAVASGIVVNAGDIYVIGTEKDASTKNRVLTVWKNGQMTSLTEGAHEDATANDLIFSNGHLYILADVFDFNSSLGWQTKLWKDGVPTIQPSESTSTLSHAMFVSNSDVYVVGTRATNAGWKGVYWKNGNAVDLNLPKENTNALCLYVLNGQPYVGGQTWDNTSNNSFYFDGSIHLMNTNPIISIFARN